MSDRYKSPRIQAEGGGPVPTMPAVSYTAPVSKAAGIAQAVSAFVQPVAKAYIEAQQVDRSGEARSTVINEMNTTIQEEIGKIGENYTPTQAQLKINSILMDRLANTPNLDPADWGRISSAVGKSTELMGKQHFFSDDDGWYAINSTTNEVRFITKPGTDPQKEAILGDLSGIPQMTQNLINRLYNEGRIEDAQALTERTLIDYQKVQEANTKSALAKAKADAYKLSSEKRKEITQANELRILRDISSLISTESDDMKLLLRTTDQNPEDAFKVFESEIRDKIYNTEGFYEDYKLAGIGPDDVYKKLKPYLDAVKEQFNSMSLYKEGSDEIETAKRRVDLTLARVQGDMSDQELFEWETTDKLARISQSLFYTQGIGKELLEEALPSIPETIRNITIGDQDITRYKSVNILPDEERSGPYLNLIQELGSKTKILLNPTTSPLAFKSMDGLAYKTLAETVINDPLWEQAKQDPKYGKTLIKLEETVRNTLKSWGQELSN